MYSNNVRAALSKATERMIAKIKEAGGTKLPWNAGHADKNGLPTSYITGNVYQGINLVELLVVQWVYGYGKYWISYPRAAEEFKTTDENGNVIYDGVKKGEQGWPVIFPVTFERTATNETCEEEVIKGMTWRAVTMFNLDQCVNPQYPNGYGEDHGVMENAEIEAIFQSLIDHDNLTIEIGDGYPSYNPKTDTVKMPDISHFYSESEYYSTKFHEVTHWTGPRLGRFDRETWNNEGRNDYGYEELVAAIAETTATALCGLTVGEEYFQNNAAYVQQWLTVLKNETEWLWLAAADAAKAIEFIFKMKKGDGDNE